MFVRCMLNMDEIVRCGWIGTDGSQAIFLEILEEYDYEAVMGIRGEDIMTADSRQ